MYPIFNKKSRGSPECTCQTRSPKRQKINNPRTIKLGDVSDDFENAMIESKVSSKTQSPFPCRLPNLPLQDYANVKQYRTGEPGVLQFLVAVDRKGFHDLLPVLQDLTRARPHKFASEHDQWKVISKALIPIGLHLERLCSKYGINEKDRERYW